MNNIDEYELECTWCGGEGYFFGEELPGFDFFWHDPCGLNLCPACRGSGLRKDQTLF